MTPDHDAAQLLVAGLGNRTHGDDGIGVRLVESLHDRVPAGVRTVVWENADAFTLAQELLDHDCAVLFVDCAHMGETPGGVRWWPEGQARVVSSREGKSTHGFGLDYAIDLAHGLGFARALYFFGVEPASTQPDSSLSVTLQEAYPQLEHELRTTVEAILVGLDP